MFSFHKPRVYRSAEGCCICRAKSSSSRFTDSIKYENDSMKCFNLTKPRKGEICNACVLLVKRFKRLPVGSNRHWGHVVDARIGPGSKSMTKFKRFKEDCTQQPNSYERETKGQISAISEKFSKIFKKSRKSAGKEKERKIRNKQEKSSVSWVEQSLPLTPESLNSDCEEHSQSSNCKNNNKHKINKRKMKKPKKNFNHNDLINFFDEKEWHRIKSCCGMVFENKIINALIIDNENYKPCAEHTISVNSLNKSTENAISVNSSNKIITNAVQKTQNHITFPVLKKHQLFLKRKVENFSQVDNILKADLNSTNEACKKKEEKDKCDLNSQINYKLNNKFLQQNKIDAGNKIIHSVDKVKVISINNDVTGVVNICEKSKLQENLCNKNIDSSNSKFSDNSSDSGFDENMLERKTSPPREEEKKPIVHQVQTMFLASGVKICGQKQNLIVTANNITNRAIQQRKQSQVHNVGSNKFIQNNNCQNDVIFNNSLKSGLITLPNGDLNTNTANFTPPLASLNQKIILVKAKYNNQPSTAN